MLKELLRGGGFWERLITEKRNLKGALEGVLNLIYEQLNTLVAEIKAIITACPLTYIADNEDGISDCLSSFHLIYGHTVSSDFFKVLAHTSH